MSNTIIATIVATVLVVGIGSWIAVRGLGRTSAGSGTPPQKKSADVGRELRRMMLTAPPEKMGATPTKEFPRVYGILMDWSIGEREHVATLFSSSTGAASLYTTSTFGIIGGEGHETVRAAAKAFVGASGRYVDEAHPTTEFPYPAPDRVRFYLLTFDGVRVIDDGLASITNDNSKYADLFWLGQAVLTELRRVTEHTGRDR